MPIRRAGLFKNAGAKLENGMKRGLIQSGRLVAQRARPKAPRDTGRLKRSLTFGHMEASGINRQLPYMTGRWRWAIDVGTNVEYARVQEFGLKNHPITAKQRRFFWAKHKETGEGMWKALGLSETYTIPAHPYLRPAIRQSRGDVYRLIYKSVIAALRKG